VMPFPKEETTPPVINTYDVICESVIVRALFRENFLAESEKQERAGSKATHVKLVLSSNPSNSAPSVDCRRC
jgi:hypothetical protein